MTMTVDIPRFFAARSVLITGGTGFMGKVLVEKLLRCCPDLDTIYLLIRGKRGVKPSDRLQEQLTKSKVFDRVREDCPEVLQKLVPIEGDVTLTELGLNSEDLANVLDKVSVVFHLAATVNFNQPLREATKLNLLGTINTVETARMIKNLKAFVYASTAFCNGKRTEVEEVVYPSSMTPEDYLGMIGSMTDDFLGQKTSSIISGHVNTYTFTKHMAENYLAQHCSELPWTIVRPAGVMGSWKDPFPGWLENKFSPAGFMLVFGSGAIHVMHGDESQGLQIVPVDVAINLLISAAWETATNLHSVHRVYNCAFKMSECRRLCEEAVLEYPMNNTYRYPACTVTNNRLLYKVLSFVQHYIPAALVDLYLLALRKKPKVVSTYNKLLAHLEDYTFFGSQPWNFTNKQSVGLQDKLTGKDKEVFVVLLDNLNWEDYVKNVFLGMRRYLLKQDDQGLPRARENLKSLYYKEKAVRASLVAFGAFLVWNRLSLGN